MIYYLYSLGVILAVSGSLLKAYRIAMIYFYSIQKLKDVVISTRSLIKYLFIAIVFELGLCFAYTIISDLNGNLVKKYNNKNFQVEYYCNESEMITLINHINFVFNFFLLVIFCYFAVRSRIASKIYKESNCAYFGSFFTLFTFLILCIFHLITNDLKILITIESGAISIVLFVIWILFYGMRMYRFYAYPNDRDTVTILNSKMFAMNMKMSSQRDLSTPGFHGYNYNYNYNGNGSAGGISGAGGGGGGNHYGHQYGGSQVSQRAHYNYNVNASYSANGSTINRIHSGEQVGGGRGTSTPQTATPQMSSVVTSGNHSPSLPPVPEKLATYTGNQHTHRKFGKIGYTSTLNSKTDHDIIDHGDDHDQSAVSRSAVIQNSKGISKSKSKNKRELTSISATTTISVELSQHNSNSKSKSNGGNLSPYRSSSNRDKGKQEKTKSKKDKSANIPQLSNMRVGSQSTDNDTGTDNEDSRISVVQANKVTIGSTKVNKNSNDVSVVKEKERESNNDVETSM